MSKQTKKDKRHNKAISMLLNPPKNYKHSMRNKINQHYQKAERLLDE